MPAGRQRRKILDGGELYRTWINLGEAGSILVLQRMLAEQGVINPATGRPPTRGGIWHAMWRWVVKHPDEGRRLWEIARGLYGFIVTDDEWYSKITRHARTVLSYRQFQKYLNENPHLKPYAEES